MLENKQSVCVTLDVELPVEGFSKDVIVKRVSDIIELRKVLVRKPRVLVFKAFSNPSSNETIVSEVKLKSPKTKIILFGLNKGQVKKSLAKNIEVFLAPSSSKESISIVAERIIFNASYSETFNEDINIKCPSNLCTVSGLALTGILFAITVYCFIEFL